MKASQQKRSRGSIAARLAVVIAMPIALLATVSGAATAPPLNPIQLTAPSGLPGTALPFPGITATTFTASASYSKLTTSPDAGVTGTPFTVSGTGLTPNTRLQLTWGKIEVTYCLV